MGANDYASAFTAVLQSDFGLDPSAHQEGEDWWRFKLGSLAFQGGVHSRDVRVSATLCKVDTDPAELDKIWSEIKEANQAESSGLGSFAEEDCYLTIGGRIPFSQVSQSKIKALIEECIKMASSATGRALCSSLQYWD